MNNKSSNKLLNVLVVISISVSVFLLFSLSDLRRELEDVQNMNYRLRADIDALENQLENMDFNADDIVTDYFYEYADMDLEKGVMNVKFTVWPYDATEDTRLVISTGNDDYELTAFSGKYTGNVEIPIGEESYDITLERYEGDLLKASELIDCLDAGIVIGERVDCWFSGLASYGNNRLTLAGEITYGMNLPESISSAKFVFADEEVALSKNVKGYLEINMSHEVEVNEEGHYEMTYVEILAESGVIYRLYPYVYAYSNYQVNDESVVGPDQAGKLVIVSPNGAEYEMMLYSDEY